MKKKILGLKIETNRISWAIVEENVSKLPSFPPSEEAYEIKEDKYIVDSTEEDVVVFKIVHFDNPKDRETFKTELRKKYSNIFGADSKEETGLYYLIFSDNIYSDNQRELQERAIHAMDWLISELINISSTL